MRYKFKKFQKTDEDGDVRMLPELPAVKNNIPLGKIITREMKIEDLAPAEYNPRRMSDKARMGLSNSLNTFGLVQPIIWNEKTGRVVGGHQRLYDMIAKGAKVTDVIVVNLSTIEEKALNIALNNPGISGDFDEIKLNELLDEISAELPHLMDELQLTDLKLLIPSIDSGDISSEPEMPGDPMATIKISMSKEKEYILQELRGQLETIIAEHFSEHDIRIQ